MLGAVFVAEIGDVHRFARAGPVDLLGRINAVPPRIRQHVHRGRITKQGSRLVRWAAIESVKILPETSHIGAIRDQVGDRRGTATSAWLRPPDDNSNSSSTRCVTTTSVPCRHHPRRHEVARKLGRLRIVQVMTPEPGVVAPSD